MNFLAAKLHRFEFAETHAAIIGSPWSAAIGLSYINS